jgi:hypothetical protein
MPLAIYDTGNAQPFSNSVQTITLQPNTPAKITVPATADVVEFASDGLIMASDKQIFDLRFVSPGNGFQSVKNTSVLTNATTTGFTPDVPATAGYQVVAVGGAKTGASATGLVDDVAATAGYQEVNVGGAKTGASATGLANDATVYTASISVDGGAHVREISIIGSAAQTYTDLLIELNADSGAWYEATLVGGNIRIASLQPGATSAIATTDTDLFATLTDYVAILAAVAGTDIIVTTYTASIAIDGVATPISVDGGAAQDYTTLLAELNTDLGAAAVASLVGGNIQITSTTTGVASTILITDTNLFSTLTDYTAISAAVDGVAIMHTLYKAAILVDGTVTVNVEVNGTEASTIGDLIDLLNVALADNATVTIDGEYLIITSLAGTTASTILITDDIADPLSSALTTYGSIEAAVIGGYQKQGVEINPGAKLLNSAPYIWIISKEVVLVSIAFYALTA